MLQLGSSEPAIWLAGACRAHYRAVRRKAPQHGKNLKPRSRVSVSSSVSRRRETAAMQQAPDMGEEVRVTLATAQQDQTDVGGALMGAWSRLWTRLSNTGGSMQQEALTASPAVPQASTNVEVEEPTVTRHGSAYVVSVAYRQRRKARARMARESRKRNR